MPRRECATSSPCAATRRATCGASGWPTPRGSTTPTSSSRWSAALGDFTVGVAAFPDVHPEAADLDHDVEVLVRKADAGASFAITQMVFDADTYLRLRDRVAARRDLPITPGLMPVTNFKQIARMSELMGTPLPPAVVARLEAVADDPTAVRTVGVEIATELGRADARRGGAGAPLHHHEPLDGHPRGLRQPQPAGRLGLTDARGEREAAAGARVPTRHTAQGTGWSCSTRGTTSAMESTTRVGW